MLLLLLSPKACNSAVTGFHSSSCDTTDVVSTVVVCVLSVFCRVAFCSKTGVSAVASSAFLSSVSLSVVASTGAFTDFFIDS